MVNDIEALLEEFEDEIEGLETDLYVKGEKRTRHFCALIGPKGSGKTEIAKYLKEKMKEQEKVFWVETSLDDVREIEGVKDPVWWFWIPVFKAFINQVPEEKIDGGMPEELKTIYSFYKNEGNYTSLNSDHKDDFIKLLVCYREMNLQIIWVMHSFEKMAELYPENRADRKEAGGKIYNKLFAISPKVMDKYYLNLLVLSRVEIIDLEHSMLGGSSLASAFTNIVIDILDD